jgi:hypothetical protein
MLRSAERLLGIDHPLVAVQFAKEARKRARLPRLSERTMKPQVASSIQVLQSVGELAAEYLG